MVFMDNNDDQSKEFWKKHILKSSFPKGSTVFLPAGWIGIVLNHSEEKKIACVLSVPLFSAKLQSKVAANVKNSVKQWNKATLGSKEEEQDGFALLCKVLA